MTKRVPFSIIKDGPLVERMYLNDNMSISGIAKALHRGTPTIKNYLIYKQLYKGPLTGRSKNKKAIGIMLEQHKEGQVYYCSRFDTYAKFKHYYNNACLVWLANPDFLHYAYCKKTELTQI